MTTVSWQYTVLPKTLPTLQQQKSLNTALLLHSRQQKAQGTTADAIKRENKTHIKFNLGFYCVVVVVVLLPQQKNCCCGRKNVHLEARQELTIVQVQFILKDILTLGIYVKLKIKCM